MEDLCIRSLLTEKIKLEPVYLTQNFKNEILNRLKLKIEGVCSKHGYIRKGSIELYKITPGCIEILSLNGNINYNVAFYADVCNPLVGNIIKGAKVVNMNRFGILAEARLLEDQYATSVLEIIIAKNSVNILSEIDLEEIQINQEVNVEVIGKKYNLGDKKISIIGRIVKEPIKKEPKYLSNTEDDVEEEEEEEAPPLDEEEEEEEQEEEDVEEEEDEEEKAEAEGGSGFFSEDDEFDADLLSGEVDEDDDGVISDAESI